MSLFNEEVYLQLPSSPGYSQHWDSERRMLFVQIPDGELIYAPCFFEQKISDRSMDYLLENGSHDWTKVDWKSINPAEVKWTNISWQHDSILMFGKKTPLPRYSAWYGNDDKPYTYSGLTLQPKPWNKGLLYLKEQIEPVANVTFNSVLLNWYRNGEDSISWHTDAEPELGKNPVIGSVNFGTTRKFQLRRRDDNKQKFDVPLQHGTLLVMAGETQHFWQHSVPKEPKIVGNRLNLTFRVIKGR